MSGQSRAVFSPRHRAFGRALLANLRLFGEGALLSYVALFHWLRPPTYLASKIVMPLAQMLFFVLIGTFGSGSLGPAFFIVGNALQVAAVSGIYGVTFSVGGDRFNGTLPYLFGTPANRLVMFAGRSFIHLLDGMLGVAIAFGWGVVLLGLDLSRADLGLLAFIVLVATFSTSGLGLLMGCIGLISRNVMFVNNTVYFLLLLFSGANIPLERLPGWIRAISLALPLSAGIAAARAVVAGAGWRAAAPLLLREGLIGLAWFSAGYALFRAFEREAKRRGSLEVM